MLRWDYKPVITIFGKLRQANMVYIISSRSNRNTETLSPNKLISKQTITKFLKTFEMSFDNALDSQRNRVPITHSSGSWSLLYSKKELEPTHRPALKWSKYCKQWHSRNNQTLFSKYSGLKAMPL